jgi:hypothetical protein
MAVKVYCPHCKATRLVVESQFGTELACAGCGERYTAEKSSAAPAPDPAPPSDAPAPIPGTGPSPREDHNRGAGRVQGHPKRRPPGDPARALVWPALCLGLFAALELLCFFAAMSLLDKRLLTLGGAPGPQAVASLELIMVGVVACGVKLGLVVLGAWLMWSRRGYRLSVLGALAAIFPIEMALFSFAQPALAGMSGATADTMTIVSGCCSLLWFGLGGWALALLFQHDIAARFDPDPGPEPPPR